MIDSNSLWSNNTNNNTTNELEQALKDDQRIGVEFLEMDLVSNKLRISYDYRFLQDCRGDFVEVCFNLRD